MDTEKCKALLCAIERKSLSAAGEALGYTPSGMSRLLHAMEKELGFPLLTRKRSGIYPTQECSQLLPILRRLADDGEFLTQKAAEILHMEVGTITVATTVPSSYPWLGRVIAEFRAAYPGITVQMLTKGGYSSTLCAMVEEGNLDFCIASHRPGNFQWYPLLDDPLVAWIPASSPLVDLPWITASRLAEEDFIALGSDVETDSSRYLADVGVTPNITYTARESHAAYCMVEAGLGVTINNNITAARWGGQVVQKPLRPQRIIQIGIIAPPAAEISPAAARFLDFAIRRVSPDAILHREPGKE